MVTMTSASEMRKMPLLDLLAEIRKSRLSIARRKLHIALRNDKDTAQLRWERRELARLLTVLREKNPKRKSPSLPPS